jgi:hypothetical protein
MTYEMVKKFVVSFIHLFMIHSESVDFLVFHLGVLNRLSGLIWPLVCLVSSG